MARKGAPLMDNQLHDRHGPLEVVEELALNAKVLLTKKQAHWLDLFLKKGAGRGGAVVGQREMSGIRSALTLHAKRLDGGIKNYREKKKMTAGAGSRSQRGPVGGAQFGGKRTSNGQEALKSSRGKALGKKIGSKANSDERGDISVPHNLRRLRERIYAWS